MPLNNLRKAGRKLASPDIMFFTLIWLMILVVAGTVAQKYIGLYEAQRIFFSSWILWWGPLPLPGGLATWTVVFIALSCKLIFASRWSLRHAGSIVTHMGALLLLAGGLLTSVGSVEGSMVIGEGETVAFMQDYHARELAVYDEAGATVAAWPLEQLSQGATFAIPGTPLVLEILQSCRNCGGVKRASPDANLKGAAKDIALQPMPLGLDDEANKSGAEFSVRGGDANANGIYLTVDLNTAAPQIAHNGKSYKIMLQKQRIALPFAITLEKFEKQYHPGTDMARAYRSDVVLKDGAAAWKSLIQMNEPLRYRGYTFYQSAFIEQEGQAPATVLAVVKNAGRTFPYISGSVMGFGLLLIMTMKLPHLLRGLAARATAKKAAVVVALALLALHPAQAAAQDFDNASFKHIPILDQGRVKPLASFAAHYLQTFYGATALPDMSADAWLAELLMTPERGYDRAVFNIADPRVVDALGLPRRQGHLYSFREVGAGLAEHTEAWRGIATLPAAQLTPSQKELLAAIAKIRSFGDLSRSLSLVFADFAITDSAVAEAFDVPADTRLTYIAMQVHEPELTALAQRTDKSTPTGKNILALQRQMEAMSRDRESLMFQVIPPQWDAKKPGSPWFSPWGIGFQGQGSPASIPFIGLWQQSAAAYRSGDTAAWADKTAAIHRASLAMAGAAASENILDLEVAYQEWQPLKIGMMFYGAAFLLVLASLMPWSAWLYRVSAAALVFGVAAHGAGLLARMIIMGRPPVTNLYASIIFVGFIVALAGMSYEWRQRNRIGIIVGAIAGVTLNFIGMKYDSDGDTMGTLVAVLDTNFWLSTHVVCMTIGYACCLLGAIMAHIYLVLRVTGKQREMAAELSRNIRGVSYLALFFSIVGTILGGIWADQSWGRFWGWDPKENGALLIILWLLFLTHGRVGGRLSEPGFNAGMVITAIIVALAWFGVNLLNVGLHSYGFTQGAGGWLAAYCGAEILFTAASIMAIRTWRDKTV